MKPSPQLEDKRFLALCLTAIREKHEQIVNPLVYKEIDMLAASGQVPKTQKQEYLLEIIQHYRTLPVFRKDGQRIAAKEKNRWMQPGMTLKTHHRLFSKNKLKQAPGFYKKVLNNYTSLHWSVMLGFKGIARLLISNGADADQPVSGAKQS